MAMQNQKIPKSQRASEILAERSQRKLGKCRGDGHNLAKQWPKILKCANGEVRAKVVKSLLQNNLRKRYQNNILLDAHPPTYKYTHLF